MIPRAEINALRNARMGTNRNLLKIVDPGVFTNPSVGSNLQPPRILHAHTRFDDNAIPDTRSKRPQQPASDR